MGRGEHSIACKPLKRRTMLKAVGAVGAAGALGGMLATGDWLTPAKAMAEPAEKTAYVYHCANCGSPGCCHVCTVRDGRLVAIAPNTNWNDQRFSTICLKGISEVNRIYSATRLQTPLKRVGERGEGKFESISWDEAISTVGDKLVETIKATGPTSVCFYQSSNFNLDGSMQWLPKLLGTPAGRAHPTGGGIDCGVGNGLDETTGATAPFPSPSSDIRTWTESKLIVLIGTNPAESRLHSMRFLIEAQEAGAKLVVIDPHFSPTAQRADWWLPIKPGTDAAFLTACIHEIIENELYDEEFVKAHTSCCFLVNTQTGMQLRRSAETTAEDGTPVKGDANPFMVWDEVANAPASYLDSTESALFKTVTIDGAEYKTVMQLMREQYEGATCEWASAITEIDAEDIARFAREYATMAPAFLDYGMGGVDKYASSDIVGHAMSVLFSLTGNIGKPGAGFGESIVPLQHPATMGAWKLPAEYANTPLKQSAATFTTEENPVRMLVAIGNPINQLFANFEHAKTWIASLDFVVVLNTYHAPSVDWADIVLPTCSCYETEYDHRGIQTRRDHAVLSQKVIEPLYESHSDFYIEKMLADYLGFGDLLPETQDALIEQKLAGADKAFEGITIEALDDNKCIMPLNVSADPVVSFADQKYATASGRLEVYHQKMFKHGQALPVHVPSPELENEELLGKYPLQLAQVRSRSRVHSQFAGVPWIKEVNGSPAIRINPVDADARGISGGDLVEVFNGRGSAKYRVVVADDIRPGQACIQEGWWPSQTEDGTSNFQSLSNDALQDRQRDLKFGPVIPFMDTLVEVKKA